MEDLTITHVTVTGHNRSPRSVPQTRPNSVLRRSSVHPSLATAADAGLINDVAVRAQLRRQFSRLSSASTSPNSSFALPGSSSPSFGGRHGRSRDRRPHRHHHRGDGHGRFCARLLACTPSSSTTSGTGPQTAAAGRDGSEDDSVLKATVVGCYADVNQTVCELRQAMEQIALGDPSTTHGPQPPAAPRGASDATQAGFVWLDLHGVPSAQASSDGAVRESGVHGAQANALGPLWEYLALSPADCQKLDLVRPHHSTRTRTPHFTHRVHSDLQMNSTDADTFSSASMAQQHHTSTSSSSSSSSSDDDVEGNLYDVVGLADLYDEQLEDVTDPDTVEVGRVNRPHVGVYAAHYALLQMGAQLDEIECVGDSVPAAAGATANHTTVVSGGTTTADTVARPLCAEDGWNAAAATAVTHADSSAPLSLAAIAASARPSMLLSGSVFDRQRGLGASFADPHTGWARALNASIMAVPTQAGLTASFLGFTGNEEPGSPHRASRLALRQAPIVRNSGALGVAPRNDKLIPIVGLYVLCFPNLCVTWCPRSTLCLATPHSCGSTHVVQGWEGLQRAVFARAAGHSPSARAEQPLCTATFLSMLLTTVCSAYLPDTAAILSEVDAMDAMMPLIHPEQESDQADALRRVVLLRRKLSVHRRLLYQKVRLLESLDRPVVHTLARYLIHIPRTAHAQVHGHSRHHRSPVLAGVTDTPHMTSAAVERAVRSIGSALTSEVILQHGSTRLVGDVLAAAKDDTNMVKPLRASLVRVHAQLEAARVVLGNTTLIYSSSVARVNSRASTESDDFQVKVSYISLIVMPLSALVSQFGMNCMIPGKFDPWPSTFTILIVLIVAIMAAGLALPRLLRHVGKRDLMG